MKNKTVYKLVFFVLIACIAIPLSQEPPRGGKRLNLDIGSLIFSATSEFDISFRALKDFFIEIRREYVLKGKQRSYGRDSLDYFGAYQGLILNADNVLFLDNNANYPWQIDSFHIVFPDTLTPLARSPRFRKMNDTAWKEKGDVVPQVKLFSESKAPDSAKGYILKHQRYPDSVRIVVFLMTTDSGTKKKIPVHKIRYEKVMWNTDGQATITDVTDGAQFAGGAVFSEMTQKGIVEWRPVGWIEKTNTGLIACNIWGKTAFIAKKTPSGSAPLDSIQQKPQLKLNELFDSKEKNKQKNKMPLEPKKKSSPRTAPR